MNLQTVSTVPAPQTHGVGRIRRWIIDHDDSRLFLIGYVVLSIVLTLRVSLFWLVAMVALHFVFECIKKQYDGAGRPARVVAWAAWDVKLDLLLIVIALVLAVYTSVTIGVAGLSGASRLSIFGFRTARLARLGPGLRALLPLPLKDVVLASRIACIRKLDRREILKRRIEFHIEGPSDGARARRIASIEFPWQGRWTLADKLALAFLILNIGAIAVGVYLAAEPPMQVLADLVSHLHPWP